MFFLATDADPYLAPRSECNELVDLIKDFTALKKHLELKALAVDKTKLFYYINKLTNMHCLCIPPFVVSNIFAIAYKKGHPGFA